MFSNICGSYDYYLSLPVVKQLFVCIEVCFFFSDDEGDDIIISSDEELILGLSSITGDVKKLYVTLKDVSGGPSVTFSNAADMEIPVFIPPMCSAPQAFSGCTTAPGCSAAPGFSSNCTFGPAPGCAPTFTAPAPGTRS